MLSLDTFAFVIVSVPLPTGFSCEPCRATFSASVPLTGYVWFASRSRSSSEICEAERFTAIGLDGVYAHFFRRTWALKWILPPEGELAWRLCALGAGGAASRSPFVRLACEGLALKPVRSTFHKLPFTRRLRASSCPLICGAAVDPLTLAFAVAVPYKPSCCCCCCPGAGLLSAAISCSISCRSLDWSATCNCERSLTLPFKLIVVFGVRT